MKAIFTARDMKNHERIADVLIHEAHQPRQMRTLPHTLRSAELQHSHAARGNEESEERTKFYTMKKKHTIHIVNSKMACGDAHGIGLIKTEYGWRVLLWWWHIVIINTPPTPPQN